MKGDSNEHLGDFLCSGSKMGKTSHDYFPSDSLHAHLHLCDNFIILAPKHILWASCGQCPQDMFWCKKKTTKINF